jgi:predicted ATPase
VTPNAASSLIMIPRIRLVQIKNYKSLADVSVELGPFTVLVGPNGSGKSNFVDALSFVQECLSESITLAFQRRGGMFAAHHRGDRRPASDVDYPARKERMTA